VDQNVEGPSWFFDMKYETCLSVAMDKNVLRLESVMSVVPWTTCILQAVKIWRCRGPGTRSLNKARAGSAGTTTHNEQIVSYGSQSCQNSQIP